MKKRPAPRGFTPSGPPPVDPNRFNEIPRWVLPVVCALLVTVLFRAFLFSRDMLLGMDTLTLGYQARVFFARALSETGFPLWNPHILGGTPFLESLAGGDSLHPVSVALLMLMEPYRALGWKLVLHVFLAGIFMAAWVRTLGASRGAALLGGVAAVLAPSFVTLVFPGHDGKMFVIAMTPLLFALAERIWRDRPLLFGALLSLAIAVVLFSTHFQMAYFLFGALGLWMIFRAVRIAQTQGLRRAGGRIALFLSFSVLGAGVGAIQLLPALNYVTEHSRRASTTVDAATPEDARAYASSWSLHPEEALSLIVPEFVGNSAGGRPWTTETYWGRNPFKLNHEYLGVLLFALALLAFLPLNGDRRAAQIRGGIGEDSSEGIGPSGAPDLAEASRHEDTAAGVNTAVGEDPAVRTFLAGIGLLFALFALGANTPVWRIFYEVLPGISLFRAPSMAIFVSAFALATLAALGFDRGVRAVLKPKGVGEGRAGGGHSSLIRRLGGLAGGLWLVAILTAAGIFLPLWESVLYSDLAPARALALDRLTPFIVQGFFVAGALVLGLLGFFLALRQRRIPSGVFIVGVVALVAFDLFRVSAPFVQVTDPSRLTVPDANTAFLLQRAREEPPFRVFSMVQGGQDVQPSAFGLDLAAGHHPNDLGRYRDLIGMEGSGIPEHLATFHPVVTRILNVRYIIWPDGQYGSLEGVEPLQQLRLPDGRPWVSVLPYPGLPRARLVGHYRRVEDGAALDILLNDPSFDPRVETLLEGPPPEIEPLGRTDPETGEPLPAEGSVTWSERTPDRIVLQVQAKDPSLLLLSQNWFPSWTATVNGAPVEILRSDHALQAIAVPAGDLEVVFEVRSPELRQALLLSLLSLILVTGLGLGSFLREGCAPRATPASEPDAK